MQLDIIKPHDCVLIYSNNKDNNIKAVWYPLNLIMDEQLKNEGWLLSSYMNKSLFDEFKRDNKRYIIEELTNKSELK